ncbi:hypothetical protein H6F67_03535 [Microcoleus sp. FACHB-1515]|uniref:hypothetical protein n=1 Tax=Cyanophyceae TaxID=3028117 RepID=UPI001682E4DB|nr:hypothetical protein [Microcoleus sp. FACHB-1515]MBD2088923.1 hypothetical protein [Microcoleus sp. FACHB-1515]
MVKLHVAILVSAVVWIFGSLPWLILNGILCSQPSQVCTNPSAFQQQAALVLFMDAVFLAAGFFAVRQLRRDRRTR